MNVILLSGGSGKRLWPLSNDVRSKQFLKVFRRADGTKESMAMRIYRMIKEVDGGATVTIATSESQVPQIKAQLGESVGISAEPARRDTFPAITLAAAYLRERGVSPDEPVVVCPVDPYVEADYFECLKELSYEAGKASLTLMGIEPTCPSEKYGYIIPKGKERISPVSEFREKPTEEVAKEYIDKGALWNGGVFAFKLGYVLGISRDLFGTDSYDELLERYETLPKISFDYAVAEKEKSINVVRFSGSWRDLGTWDALTEAMDEPFSGNTVAEGCDNTHVVNELQIPVIALGINDAVIVATPDGFLVSDKGRSPELKDLVADYRPMYERRDWGEYRILDYKIHEDGRSSLTRELAIGSGQHTSYQRHLLRTEVLTITEGAGELVLDGEIREIRRGDVQVIKAGVKHAIKCVTDLHIIEVQIVDGQAEGDTERLDWGWE